MLGGVGGCTPHKEKYEMGWWMGRGAEGSQLTIWKTLETRVGPQ